MKRLRAFLVGLVLAVGVVACLLFGLRASAQEVDYVEIPPGYTAEIACSNSSGCIAISREKLLEMLKNARRACKGYT